MNTRPLRWLPALSRRSKPKALRFSLLALFLTIPLLATLQSDARTALAACNGTVTWAAAPGIGDSLWTTGSNWSTGMEPGPNDDVCIDKVGNQGVTVILRANRSVKSVTLGAGSTVVVQAASSSGATLFGTSFINDAGTIDLDSIPGGEAGQALLESGDGLGTTVAGTGAINVFAGVGTRGDARVITGNLTNNGSLNVNRILDVQQGGNIPNTWNNNGPLSIGSNAFIVFLSGPGAFNQNGGAIDIATPGSFAYTGAFTFNGGSFPHNQPIVSGGSLNFGPSVPNTPVELIVNSNVSLLGDIPLGVGVRVQAGTLDVRANLINHGTIYLDSAVAGTAAALVSAGSVTLTNAATGSIVTLPGSGGARTLSANLNNLGTISVQQALACNANFSTAGGTATITNAGAFTVAAGATVSLNSAVAFNQNGGTLDIQSPDAFLVAGGTFNDNGGTLPTQPPLLSSGQLNFGAAPAAGGRIVMVGGAGLLGTNIPAGQTVELQGRDTTGNGRLNTNGAINNGTLLMDSTGSSAGSFAEVSVGGGVFTNAAGGTITVNPGGSADHKFTGGGSVANQGTLNVNYNLTLILPFTNSGRVFIGAGVTMYSEVSFTQTAGSTNLSAGSSVLKSLAGFTTISLQGGTLSGLGSVNGDLVNSGGTVNPGNSPGILTINGNYSQRAGGTLAIEIAGTTAGSQYDRLVVTGAAALSGTLALSFLNGFTPNNSDSFRVITFASRSGSFNAITAAGLVGHSVLASFDAADLTLVIGPSKVYLPLILSRRLS
jgi:fibronectin-binding autotransporter adhesin